MSSRYEEFARAALTESTAAEHVGDWVEDRERADAPGVTDVVFASTQSGYRGWSWVVSIAEIEGDASTSGPTVLELGLLPGEDSLVAPEWIPWSVRLAEWQAQQAVVSEDPAESDSDDDPADEADELDESDDDDDDDLDDDDDDLDGPDDDVLDDDIPLEDLIGDDDPDDPDSLA